jgi:hypothetical protein
MCTATYNGFGRPYEEDVLISYQRCNKCNKDRAFIHRLNGTRQYLNPAIVRAKIAEAKRGER